MRVQRNNEPQLKLSPPQQLDRSSLTMLVVASMIGAAVYTTSGFSLASLKNPYLVLLAWAVGGVIAICGAISYGQLASKLSENGGEYLYLTRFVHPVAGTIVGWVSFLAGFTGAAAYAAITFEKYAWPNEARPTYLPVGSLALILVMLCTLIHAINTRRGAITQNAIVLTKLILISVFIIVSYIAYDKWQGNQQLLIQGNAVVFSWFNFATAVMWISLSYSGFNAAIYVAGEARRGAIDIRWAMVCGTVLVTLLYLLLNVIFLFAPTGDSIVNQPDIAAIAAAAIGGRPLSILVRAAICLGLASSVSSALMTGPRVYAKMAGEGSFPRLFASDVSPPLRSIILQAVAIAIVICITNLQSLLGYLGMTLALSAAATVSTLFIQKDRRLCNKRNLIAPALFVASTMIIAAMAAWNKPAEAIATLATIAIGVVYYFINRQE